MRVPSLPHAYRGGGGGGGGGGVSAPINGRAREANCQIRVGSARKKFSSPSGPRSRLITLSERGCCCRGQEKQRGREKANGRTAKLVGKDSPACLRLVLTLRHLIIKGCKPH